MDAPKTDPVQLADRVLAAIRPAIDAELANAEARLLSRAGVLERLAVSRLWHLVEDEVPALVSASLAELLRRYGGATLADSIAAILDRESNPGGSPRTPR